MQDLAIASEVGNRAGEGRAYLGLGNAHRSLGDFSQAIEYQHAAPGDCQAGGRPGGGGRGVRGLGNAHWSLGDFSQAIKCHTQHLAIAREVGDRAGEGTAGHNLGLALE